MSSAEKSEENVHIARNTTINLHKQFAQSDDIFWKISHVSKSIRFVFIVFMHFQRIFTRSLTCSHVCKREKQVAGFLELEALEIDEKLVAKSIIKFRFVCKTISLCREIDFLRCVVFLRYQSDRSTLNLMSDDELADQTHRVEFFIN